MNDMPAFPVITATGINSMGMTLRDYFAAKAMPICATFYDTNDEVLTEAAHWCYAMADAMLKARAK